MPLAQRNEGANAATAADVRRPYLIGLAAGVVVASLLLGLRACVDAHPRHEPARGAPQSAPP